MKYLNVLLPVITLILGYLGTILTEERRANQARTAAADERERAARQLATERRRDFELEHLLAAEQALRRMGTATRVRLSPDTRTEDAVAAKQQVNDANVDTSREGGYVLDPVIRDLVETARRAEVELNGQIDEGQEKIQEKAHFAALAALVAAREAIQERVRALYDEAVTTS
jgi:hypothetical protein